MLGDWDDIYRIESQLFKSEHTFLRDFAHKLTFENPTIVNVGVWKGASCYCLRIGSPQARLVAIDVMGVYSVETNLLKYLLDSGMEVIKRNSNYVDWTDDPIHLLFIDGGHEYEVVKRDIEIYASCVVKDGYVVFHDSRRDEVKEAIKDYINLSEWKEWVLDPPVGSLQVFKRI